MTPTFSLHPTPVPFHVTPVRCLSETGRWQRKADRLSFNFDSLSASQRQVPNERFQLSGSIPLSSRVATGNRVVCRAAGEGMEQAQSKTALLNNGRLRAAVPSSPREKTSVSSVRPLREAGSSE